MNLFIFILYSFIFFFYWNWKKNQKRYRTSVMLTVVSIIVGVSSVSIVTMWIYDMQQSGVVMSNSSASSEVWFLTFVYELTVKRILSDMWATLVFAMVFLSGFLSLVSKYWQFNLNCVRVLILYHINHQTFIHF